MAIGVALSRRKRRFATTEGRAASAGGRDLLTLPPSEEGSGLPWDREAVLAGLARILDAASLEELFAGSEAEAAFLHGVLLEVSRGRGASLGAAIRRTARLRGTTAAFVVDRAAAFCAAMAARRREDLYRILGVPPLASGETIDRRWQEIVRERNGADDSTPGCFEPLEAAWQILRDPVRRARYEEFWRRALWPFERVAGRVSSASPTAQ